VRASHRARLRLARDFEECLSESPIELSSEWREERPKDHGGTERDGDAVVADVSPERLRMMATSDRGGRPRARPVRSATSKSTAKPMDAISTSNMV
jgi:hypothetical protein